MEEEKEKKEVEVVNQEIDLHGDEEALGVEYELVIGEKKRD